MKASGGRGASLFPSGDLGVARTTGCPVIWRSKSPRSCCAVRSVFGTVREKPLGVCRVHWTALGPQPARSAGHSCEGSSQPRDANAQGFSAEVPDQSQGLFS